MSLTASIIDWRTDAFMCDSRPPALEPDTRDGALARDHAVGAQAQRAAEEEAALHRQAAGRVHLLRRQAANAALHGETQQEALPGVLQRDRPTNRHDHDRG